MQIRDIPINYERTFGAILRLTDTDVVKAGDTERAAELPVRVVKRRNLPVHPLPGVFAVDAAQDYSRWQLAEADGWREVSTSAEFHRTYPIELPAENPADQSAH